MAGRPLPDLSVSEWAVLALVAEAPTHGFAVARDLAPEGPLGRVWTVPRPVVYRAMAHLSGLGLLEERGSQPGAGGPRRTLVAATRRGRAANRRWLLEPVEHVRDLRSHLLVKLALLERRGEDPLPLVRVQREHLAVVVDGLRSQIATAEGFDEVLVRWRYEAVRGALRFLDGLLARPN